MCTNNFFPLLDRQTYEHTHTYQTVYDNHKRMIIARSLTAYTYLLIPNQYSISRFAYICTPRAFAPAIALRLLIILLLSEQLYRLAPAAHRRKSARRKTGPIANKCTYTCTHKNNVEYAVETVAANLFYVRTWVAQNGPHTYTRINPSSWTPRTCLVHFVSYKICIAFGAICELCEYVAIIAVVVRRACEWLCSAANDKLYEQILRIVNSFGAQQNNIRLAANREGRLSHTRSTSTLSFETR